MQPLLNYKRIFHPRLGRFVYKHKGSGLIVDNIFKPMKKMLPTATKAVLKPLAKKALKSGIESAGDKIGKKAVDYAGDKFGKKFSESPGLTFLKEMGTKNKTNSNPVKGSTRPTVKDYNGMLNSMIQVSQPKVGVVHPQGTKTQPAEEDYNLILNRMISGSGVKKVRKNKK